MTIEDKVPSTTSTCVEETLVTGVAVNTIGTATTSSNQQQKAVTLQQHYQAGHQQGAAYDEKVGHSCCGCCCDMRRAVIICNVVSLVSSIIWIVLLIVGVWGVTGGIIDVDDDDGTAVFSTPANVSWFFALLMTAVILGLIFYSVGIWAARQYNVCGIIATTIWYGIAIILNILSVNVGGIILHTLFLYPHIMFWLELQKKIITPENYQRREEQSCCCI